MVSWTYTMGVGTNSVVSCIEVKNIHSTSGLVMVKDSPEIFAYMINGFIFYALCIHLIHLPPLLEQYSPVSDISVRELVQWRLNGLLIAHRRFWQAERESLLIAEKYADMSSPAVFPICFPATVCHKRVPSIHLVTGEYHIHQNRTEEREPRTHTLSQQESVSSFDHLHYMKASMSET